MTDSITKLLEETYLIEQSTQRMKKHYEPYIAGDFSPFSFFRVHETHISQIFAFLLNPNETHAQGELFLKEFLRLLSHQKTLTGETVSLLRLNHAQIVAEKRIDPYGQFDILISDAHHGIVIENKIFNAHDQNKQLQSYGKYLEEHHPRHYLVYLSTHEPTRYSLPADHRYRKFTIFLPCRLFLKSLEKTLLKIQAPKVQFFVSRLIAYLRKSTMSAPHNDLVIENILSNKQHLQAAFQIAEAFPQLVENALDIFIKTLQKKIRPLSQKIDIQYQDPSQWKKSQWFISFSFTSHRSDIWQLTFECERTFLNSFFWGINWTTTPNTETSKHYEKIIQDMMRQIFDSNYSRTDNWPFWIWSDRTIKNTSVYESTLYSPQALQRLALPEEHPALLNFIMEKVKAIDRFLKEHPDYFQKASA